MKNKNDLFLYYGRQNGKYNLSLEQLLEKIKKIKKSLSSTHWKY